MIETDLYIIENLTKIINILLQADGDVVDSKAIPKGFKEIKKELKKMIKNG